MPRTRIAHRFARGSDQRAAVAEPRGSAGLTRAEMYLDGEAQAATALRSITLDRGGVPYHAQMKDVHPLRLRLLLEIDRTGSISAAAERCAIGQPSASMHVRALEKAIGQRLVIRHGRGSKLTAAGNVVASHAARMLATLESMRSAMDALNAPATGELVLAASDTPTLALIPPVLREVSERYPGVSVRLRTLPSETVVREVARGAADIGIAGEVASTDPVVRQQIMIDELVGIAPVGLLSSDPESVSMDEFARHSLLLGPPESSTRIITERHLSRGGHRPARIWEFDSSEGIKRAVVEGIGVSFMSRLLVDDEIERGDLAPFRISGLERIMRPIYAVEPSLAELTPHAAWFKALMMDAHRAPGPAAASAESPS